MLLSIHSTFHKLSTPNTWCACMLSQCSCVQLFVSPWTVACQAFLSMGFSSPGKNTGEGCCALLQGIFPTQRLNLDLRHLLHCRQILYLLSHQGRWEVLLSWWEHGIPHLSSSGEAWKEVELWYLLEGFYEGDAFMQFCCHCRAKY